MLSLLANRLKAAPRTKAQARGSEKNQPEYAKSGVASASSKVASSEVRRSMPIPQKMRKAKVAAAAAKLALLRARANPTIRSRAFSGTPGAFPST
jgi:hypothetical protein